MPREKSQHRFRRESHSPSRAKDADRRARGGDRRGGGERRRRGGAALRGGGARRQCGGDRERPRGGGGGGGGGGPDGPIAGRGGGGSGRRRCASARSRRDPPDWPMKLTRTWRPSISPSSRWRAAASAQSWLANSTYAYPFGRPAARSIASSTVDTGPNSSKISRRWAMVTSSVRFDTASTALAARGRGSSGGGDLAPPRAGDGERE